MLTPQQIEAMSANLPTDPTYIVTNTTIIEAPLDFVWEHLPKSLDITRIMRPYRGLPGAARLETSATFNRAGSSVTYTMTDGSTIEETILKRDNYHYVYGYLPPMSIFDFWQGNLFYSIAPGNRTKVVWRYWIKPRDSLLGKLGARLVKRFIWRGYTARAIVAMKAEVEGLYASAQKAPWTQ